MKKFQYELHDSGNVRKTKGDSGNGDFTIMKKTKKYETR